MPENCTVRPGDCIASIAFERGFFPDTIWKDSSNKDLKSQRKDPDVLMAGDVVSIPDLRLKEVEKPSGQKHRFQRKGVPKLLRLRLLESDETPVANATVRLDIDGRLVQTRTDSDGWISQQISPAARQAIVTLGDGTQYSCKLGHLSPIDTLEGIQQRLHNLGYYSGPITGKMTDDVSESLRHFQGIRGLTETGTADESTRVELLRLSND